MQDGTLYGSGSPGPGRGESEEESFSVLLGRARAGDAQAQDALFGRSAAALLRHVRSRLGPELGARLEPLDVLQETWVAALKGLARFEDRGERAFQAWLRRLAENAIRDLCDHFRAAKRTPPGLEERWSQVAGNLARAETRGPATRVDGEGRRARLMAALAQLEGDERRVLELRYFHDASFESIAEVLGCGATTARRLAGRAIAKVGTLLGEGEGP